jgi:hypothetical protein
VRIPIFAVVSQDDATVDTAATIKLMTHAEHPANKLVYYYSDPDKIPTGLGQDKIECVNCVLSEQNIISSAHTAIVLPREDEYYGDSGAYCNCPHYSSNEMDKFQICRKQAATTVLGEISKKNLKNKNLRRLIFNPHFDALKAEMKNFIAKLP